MRKEGRGHRGAGDLGVTPHLGQHPRGSDQGPWPAGHGGFLAAGFPVYRAEWPGPPGWACVHTDADYTAGATPEQNMQAEAACHQNHRDRRSLPQPHPSNKGQSSGPSHRLSLLSGHPKPTLPFGVSCTPETSRGSPLCRALLCWTGLGDQVASWDLIRVGAQCPNLLGQWKTTTHQLA